MLVDGLRSSAVQIGSGDTIEPSDGINRSRDRYYPSLDGLRALAVGIVLTSHAGAPFLRSGGVGVDVFFTLSGFLITSILLHEFQTYGSISLRNFYIRRFLRLMPALWLTVFFMLVSVWALDVRALWPLREAAFALTYSTNWAHIFGLVDRVTLANGYILDSPLSHTWSLAIEEQYYLLWPLVIGAICSWLTTRRTRLWTLIALFGMLVLYRASMVGRFSVGRIYFGLDTHADGLVLGSAVAALLAAYPTFWSDQPRFVKRAATMTAVAALLTVMALWTKEDAMMGLVGYAICAVASSVLVLEGVAHTPNVLQSTLTQPPLVWLGRLSYGIYLWHFPLYFVLRHWSVIWNWQRLLLVGGGGTLVMAAASYYLVETRFLRLKARYVRENVSMPTRVKIDDSLSEIAMSQVESS